MIVRDLDFSEIFEVSIESELTGEKQLGVYEKNKRRQMESDDEKGP